MDATEKLITDCTFELIEDHHSFGSGRYSGRVLVPADISGCFPYLNAVLTESRYDHENRILIGSNNGRRYAFRPHEIQLGGVPEPDRAPELVDEVVALVNRVWSERDTITPSLKERDLPTVIEIYQLLPRTNCRECGYVTCLACAADLRDGSLSPEVCPCLAKPEYAANREKLLLLLDSDG
jgi:ArsR family metal-binding transcriptional regulator